MRFIRKDAAFGVDRVSAQEYELNLDDNIRQLVERLKGKRYRAKLVRRQYIPKGNGKLRPLGIPATEDKLTIKLQFGKYNYVVEADIKGFFDNLDHEWLLKMVAGCDNSARRDLCGGCRVTGSPTAMALSIIAAMTISRYKLLD